MVENKTHKIYIMFIYTHIERKRERENQVEYELKIACEHARTWGTDVSKGEFLDHEGTISHFGQWLLTHCYL